MLFLDGRIIKQLEHLLSLTCLQSCPDDVLWLSLPGRVAPSGPALGMIKSAKNMEVQLVGQLNSQVAPDDFGKLRRAAPHMAGQAAKNNRMEPPRSFFPLAGSSTISRSHLWLRALCLLILKTMHNAAITCPCTLRFI
jgi:hypothetical protein